MGDEWQYLSVDAIKATSDSAIAIGPFGSRMKSELYEPSGVTVIRGTNITETRSLAGEFVFVSEDTADNLRSSRVFADDLVFPHRGAIGRVGIVPANGERFLLSSSLMKLTCNTKVAHSKFIYYFFRSAEGKHALLRNSSTVGTPGIGQPLTSLKSIVLPVPPMKEQRAIAHILGTLDDKIELNRRMSETLEAMARALFKSWFVDFDPVHAKAEGREMGLPDHVAKLFPSGFEHSESGEIPKGWINGKLADVADHPRRGVQPQEIDPSTAYIALEHMPKGSINLSEWEPAERVESNKFEFKKGEILFGKLRPYFHKVGVAPVDGVCSTDIVVVAQRKAGWFGFILGHVSSTAFVDYANAGSTGTKMPRTSWSEMARYSLVLPNQDIAEAFTDQINSWVERIIVSTHESRTLAALRDTLLPKLISGELRVGAVEGVLKKAL